ncbi:hypothetical protein HHK36_025532 [Tetracentron sinense]|uniref:IST1-like protein n=1 Tax=Tetracentron sinense TaxID=13715 RepID=A0A834YMS8_TETSI|nr:hypothetical protein HHK36_025532 [Tetracentron sinense]
MLHRSFKATKCKTSLRLVVARTKLLKNKTETKLRQMKKELAQLLEAGQEQTARIRVEHVVREEKIMAAYDLIEIYCELLVARLPIIESQKNCPIDLKEAICSVIFASPRCADIPELLDVRKHFTAKYGKEFISSALELRPDCGVSRTMVEKLSARAPDGQTKIKILTAIAQEQNIKWDPDSFGEKDSRFPNDLLNGPSTMENVSTKHVESPNVQLSHSPGQKQESSVNLSENIARLSPSSQAFDSTGIITHNATMPATSHPEMRPSGSETEGREFRRPFSEGENAFTLNKQNWNMKFKDATSAAQAAAESAERASMAARAAAELSSRGKITRQYSTESHESSVYGFRDEVSGISTGPKLQEEPIAKDSVTESPGSSVYGFRDEVSGKLTGPKLQGEPIAKDSVTEVHDSPKLSSYDVDPRVQNQQREENKQDNLPGVAEGMHSRHGRTKRRSNHSASSGSSIESIDDDDISMTYHPKADRDSQKSSYEVEAINPNWQGREPEKGDFLREVTMNKQSSESVVEFVNQQQHSKKTEYSDHSVKARITKQPSRSASSLSHVSTFDYDDDAISNSNLRDHGNDGGEHSFLSSDKGNIQRGTKQPNSNDSSAVVFDESSSDDDCNFDVEYGYNEPNLHFRSPGKESPFHPSSNTNTWSPSQNRSETLEEKSSAQPLLFTGLHFPSESENLMNSALPSQSDDLLPAMFDDSDGPSSENEEEMDNYKHRERTESSSQHQKQNVYTRSPAAVQTDSHGSTGSSFMRKDAAGGKKKLSLQSSFDDSDAEESHSEKNQETELNVSGESWKKYGIGNLKTGHPSPRRARSHGNSDDLDQESFYSPVVEGKQQPFQSSRLSLAQEVRVKDDVGTPPSDTTKMVEISNHSSSESGQELNFGMLTGGLRNKGYRRPPYTRGPSGDASLISRPQAAEDTSTTVVQPTVSPTVKTISSEAGDHEPYNQKTHVKVHKESSSRAIRTFFDPDSDDDAEEVLPSLTVSSKDYTGSRLSRRTKDSPAKSETDTPTRFTVGSAVPVYFDPGNDDAEKGLPLETLSSKGYTSGRLSRRTKDFSAKSETGIPMRFTAKSAVPVYSGLDSGDSEEVPLPQTVSSKGYTGSRVSHRTKDSPAKSETGTPSFTVGSGAPVKSDFGMGKKSSLRSSYATEPPSKPQSHTIPLGTRKSSELPRTNASVEPPPFKPMPESDILVPTESLKSSAVEQPFNPLPKNVSSGNIKSPETSSSSRGTESASRENSQKKAGHVHPKLPDYDTFTAHFETLRSNQG